MTGVMVVHCHLLMHEDYGMMTLEKIDGEKCQCSEGYNGTKDDYFYGDGNFMMQQDFKTKT
jgi:hypothetical protein